MDTFKGDTPVFLQEVLHVFLQVRLLRTAELAQGSFISEEGLAIFEKEKETRDFSLKAALKRYE